MSVRIVNCHRGDKVVGSFVIEVGYLVRAEQLIHEQCIEAAKLKLAAAKTAVEPFEGITFVVR